MKVAVYAICKNERQFLDRWLVSMSEADTICVLDTGSTDGTCAKLKDIGSLWVNRGTCVKEVPVICKRSKIEPWRFDVARNESLKLIPADTDICVCTDLDEVFRPGWRAALEAAWVPGTDICRYEYVWNFNADGSDGVTFLGEKIHRYGSFRWAHPVHEVLERAVDVPAQNNYVHALGVRLEHHADNTKPRTSYLPLLELSIIERPEDDRNSHYLGREYMYYGRYDEAIAELKRHLSLPSATWADERCASMRYIAKCYAAIGDDGEARRWLLRACGEAPGLREPWYELAGLLYRSEDWYGIIWAAEQALAITERSMSYINEPEAWGAGPWDLLSLGYWYTGARGKALEAAERAVERAPRDERLRRNLELMREGVERAAT